MARYLIDINLPYYFSLWNTDEYVHQRDLNPRAADTDIWNYAKSHNLTVITKDRDYSDRILLLDPPPHVIHLRVGNMKLRDFHLFMSVHWSEIIEMSKTHKLVYVFKNRIEGVS